MGGGPFPGTAQGGAGGIGTPPAQRPDRPSLSLVVPCRNEARNLETLLLPLLARLTKLAERWEVVLVDDGSTDDTRGSDAQVVARCRAFAPCSCRATSARKPR